VKESNIYIFDIGLGNIIDIIEIVFDFGYGDMLLSVPGFKGCTVM